MSAVNNSLQYSSDDMLRMQQEAIQRVQQMQRQAQNKVDQTNRDAPLEGILQPQPPTPPVFNPHQMGQNQQNPQRMGMQGAGGSSGHGHSSGGLLSNLLGGGLGGLGSSFGGIGETVSSLTDIPKKAFSSITSILEEYGIDNEKLILIVVIFLLANEEGDKTLLLALGYLLFF